MVSPQEILDGGAGTAGDVVRGAVGLITAGTIVMNSIAKVPKNHRGYRTVRGNPERTWGRKKGARYGAVGSGFHVVYPFVGGIESRSIQRQPQDLPSFTVECTDGKH